MTLAITSSVSNQTIDDLNRLNSWVRSKSFRQSGSLREWIYHLKRETLERLYQYEPHRVVSRAISVQTRCNKCGGTGLWSDWYSWSGPVEKWPCRACGKTGSVRLEFVETMIDGAVKWHTPRMKAWGLKYEWPEQGGTPELDWSPNQIGLDLRLDVALIILMRVERAVGIKSVWKSFGRAFEWDEYDISRYMIRVDRDDDPKCVLCGAMPPEGKPWMGHSFSVGRLDLSLRACEACAVTGDIWDRLRPPERWEHLLSPIVKEWVATHPVRERMRT